MLGWHSLISPCVPSRPSMLSRRARSAASRLRLSNPPSRNGTSVPCVASLLGPNSSDADRRPPTDCSLRPPAPLIERIPLLRLDTQYGPPSSTPFKTAAAARFLPRALIRERGANFPICLGPASASQASVLRPYPIAAVAGLCKNLLRSDHTGRAAWTLSLRKSNGVVREMCS